VIKGAFILGISLILFGCQNTTKNKLINCENNVQLWQPITNNEDSLFKLTIIDRENL
jgi:hypothetical protein